MKFANSYLSKDELFLETISIFNFLYVSVVLTGMYWCVRIAKSTLSFKKCNSEFKNHNNVTLK